MPSFCFLKPSWVLAVLLVALFFGASQTQAETRIFNRQVGPRQTFSEALHGIGLSETQIQVLVTAMKEHFDFRKVHARDQFRVVLKEGELISFDYRKSAIDEWLVRKENGVWRTEKQPVQIERRIEKVTLSINDSLYDAVVTAGESQGLAMSLADVFAWDIDFYRDPQKGDVAVALIEKDIHEGKTVGYGNILAASYRGETVGEKHVFRYALPNGEIGYFLPDGTSARKTFLKSPLKYANITSSFGGRFHPVLKFMKNHNGIDYGTPVGTPVWAVADGTVTRKGWHRGGGNTLCLRHNNGLETCYLHLSRFAEGVRAGGRVQQKQIVAYSGNTGMSTGPHLHFEMRRGGQPINPLKQSFPRADPLPPSLLADFQVQTGELAKRMRDTSAGGSSLAK